MNMLTYFFRNHFYHENRKQKSIYGFRKSCEIIKQTFFYSYRKFYRKKNDTILASVENRTDFSVKRIIFIY